MSTATADSLLSLPAAATQLGVSYFQVLHQLRRHPELDARIARVSGRRVIDGAMLAELRALLSEDRS